MILNLSPFLLGNTPEGGICGFTAPERCAAHATRQPDRDDPAGAGTTHRGRTGTATTQDGHTEGLDSGSRLGSLKTPK